MIYIHWKTYFDFWTLISWASSLGSDTLGVLGGSSESQLPVSHRIPRVNTEMFIYFLGCTTVQQVGSYFFAQGWNLWLLDWEHRVLTTRLPGKSLTHTLRIVLSSDSHSSVHS